MRIVHVASRDQRGGAARAAAGLHAGLRRLGLDSRMFVRERFGVDPAVLAFAPGEGGNGGTRAHEIAREFDAYADTRPGWCERFSDDRSELGAEVLAQLPAADVTVLHWVSGFVDYGAVVPALARRAPLVWMLHDLNPFTGGCHYDAGCGRWVEGCGACPQLGSRAPDDLAARIWRRKRALFRGLPDHALHVVAASRWLGDCARAGLLGRFSVSVVPTAVDTDVFAPRDRMQARAALGIPAGAFVVLFTATALHNPRKGLRHLADAFAAWPRPPELLLLTVGRDDPAHALPVPRRHLGLVEHDADMAQALSAADVTVVPSAQDNLPMSALESLACGTPVVGFDTGGIPDIVRPGHTGMLVPPGDPRALGEVLRAWSQQPARAARMRPLCRAVALSDFSLAAQARRHLELYRTLRRPWDGVSDDRAAPDSPG